MVYSEVTLSYVSNPTELKLVRQAGSSLPEWFLKLNTGDFKAYLLEHKEIWKEISYFVSKCPQFALMIEGFFMEGFKYASDR